MDFCQGCLSQFVNLWCRFSYYLTVLPTFASQIEVTVISAHVLTFLKDKRRHLQMNKENILECISDYGKTVKITLTGEASN